MRITDLLYETFSALTANKVRSLLTILGIIIGIAAVILLVALMQGYEQTLFDQMGGDQANLLTFWGDGFKEKDRQKLKQAFPDIRLIESTIQYPGTPSYDGKEAGWGTTGVSELYTEVQKVSIVSGRWFTQEEHRSASQVIVLGRGFADELFGKDIDPIGRQVSIGKREFTVIGVTGTSSMSMDFYTNFVTQRAGDKYLADANFYGGENLFVLFERGTDMSLAGQEVQSYLNINYGEDRYWVNNFADFAEEIRKVFSVLTLIVSAIAGISLVVGGIGIMNMMLTTVTERIREIGLRKALGAKRSAIILQFLMESVILCVLGGLIGVLMGYLGSILGAYLIRMFAADQVGDFRSKLALWSIALAVGVSSFIGLVFGIYPARRAAKLDPVEALRYQ